MNEAAARLCGLLREAADCLRHGEDQEGIGSLLCALRQMEEMAKENAFWNRADSGRLLPVMRMLYGEIKNNDIAGIADLLEDALYPMAGEWMKGSDGI